MDDLIQLVFFLVLVLFGLLSGSRKKRVPPRPGPARAREGREPAGPAGPVRRVERPAETSRVVARQAFEPEGVAPEARKTDGLFELWESGILTEPALVETPTAEAIEFGEEAYSLETIEPEVTEVPEEARERRPAAADAATPSEPSGGRKGRLDLTRETLQHAFVMKEILGPPKGLVN